MSSYGGWRNWAAFSMGGVCAKIITQSRGSGAFKFGRKAVDMGTLLVGGRAGLYPERVEFSWKLSIWP